MIQVGDMVGFEFRGEKHLAIITEDLGKGYPYGRFTGLVVGSDGDLIPLSEDEITLLSSRLQVDQWERHGTIKKIMDRRSKNDRTLYIRLCLGNKGDEWNDDRCECEPKEYGHIISSGLRWFVVMLVM